MSLDIARHLMIDFTQMKTFTQDPLVLVHGEGIRVTDDRGRTYIDGLSGVFTSNLGHANPEIAEALASQARRLAFGAPTLGTNARAAELVERLVALVPSDFSTLKLLSGGSEANEAAIKLARQFHKQTGRATKFKILSHYRGYHGRTGNALAASGCAGHTYGGNPVACGAGLAALEYMQAYDVVAQVEQTGTYLRRRLSELAVRHASVRLVRGRGMLQAIVFDTDMFAPDQGRQIGLEVTAEARRRGLLLRAAPWFIAVAPPLVATRQDVDAILDILDAALSAVEQSHGASAVRPRQATARGAGS